MPQYFSDETVEFLEHFQYITHRKEGAVPTDCISLLDVCLHTNSICSMLFTSKTLPLLVQQPDEGGVIHMLSATSASVGASAPGQGDNGDASGGSAPTTVDDLEAAIANDLRSFDARLSEDLLAPVLFSLLDFYVDRRLRRDTIRQGLCAYFEATPYLREREFTDRAEPMFSSVGFLFLILTKALLQCERKKKDFVEVTGCKRIQALPPLPWLKSRAEYTVGEPTWYWHEAQSLSTIQMLLALASVHYGTVDSDEESRETVEAGADDGFAINVVCAAPLVSATRQRRYDQGIFPVSYKRQRGGGMGSVSRRSAALSLPGELQELILEYLSPADLPVAKAVCRTWHTIIERSVVMQFYLLAGTTVTRVFFQYMNENWGKAWLRVDKLTTMHRLLLQKRQLRECQAHLDQLRCGRIIVRLIEEISHNVEEHSTEWNMLAGMWSAIEVEMKQFPFAPHPTVSMMQYIREKRGNTAQLIARTYSGMKRETICAQLLRNTVLLEFFEGSDCNLVLEIVVTQVMYFINGERKAKTTASV